MKNATHEIKSSQESNVIESPNNSVRATRREDVDRNSEKLDPFPSGYGKGDRDDIDPVKERKLLWKFDVFFVLLRADSSDIRHWLVGTYLLIGQS